MSWNADTYHSIDADTDNGVVEALVERYFVTGCEEQGASSHWRLYHQRVSAHKDATGSVTDLVGDGFGTIRFRSWKDRVLQEACIAMHLAHLPRRGRLGRVMAVLARVNKRSKSNMTFDAFRQVCTFELIDFYLPGTVSRAPRVLIIGDGHGTLAALVKEAWPRARLCLVDLGRTLAFQALHCQMAHPERSHQLAGGAAEDGEADFLYCQADQFAQLREQRFDVAINVNSMQEMDPGVTAEYFSLLRRRTLRPENLFYCSNRERKVLPAGEVSCFRDYPWSPADQVLVDGECPWDQYFVSRSGGRRVTVLGLAVPLVRRYDGGHLHRLVVMDTGHR